MVNILWYSARTYAAFIILEVVPVLGDRILLNYLRKDAMELIRPPLQPLRNSRDFKSSFTIAIVNGKAEKPRKFPTAFRSQHAMYHMREKLLHECSYYSRA